MKMQKARRPIEEEPTPIRRQDLFCLLLYFFGFSLIRNLFFRWRRVPVVRILAFHDLPFNQVRCFREKLEVVQKVANVVNLDDIFSGKMSMEKINVVITFDDGYRGWFQNVCPVLKDLGMSATFFVSSGLIGLREEDERKFLKKNLMSNAKITGSITSNELKKLAREGFSIGGHTCNHVNLKEVKNLNELYYEIQEDKKKLEKITGTLVRYFAYPFGFHSNPSIDLVKIIKESGYNGAVTLVPGFITSGTNRYFLNRDLVRPTMHRSVFKARLLGNYDGVIYFRKILGL